MHYVDVALKVRRGAMASIFTYAIPPDLLLGVAPGVVVEVPFRAELALGIITRLRQTLPTTRLHGRLRSIRRILSPWPLLTKMDLELRETLARQTLQAPSLTFTAGLPPRSLYQQIDAIPSKTTAVLPSRSLFYCDTRPESIRRIAEQIFATVALNQTTVIVVPTYEMQRPWVQMLSDCKPNLSIMLFDPQAKIDQLLPIWQAVLTGTNAVIIGTRSILLLPFRQLGLTIIDQPSHHQLREEQAPHYSAWQVARLRHRLAGGTLIARDVLPPFELLNPAERRVWHFEQTPNLHPPKVHILRRSKANQLELTTLEAVGELLDNHQRLLVVTPQTGWARGLICRDCEHFPRCPACHHILGLPTETGELTCSVCQKQIPQPTVCPNCASSRLVPFGWGNSQWQNYLAEHFPDTNICVDNLQDARNADIVITTPSWSLLPQKQFDVVLAIEPERLLFGTDFRATEGWLQFLLRLREHAKTRLLIETNIPDEQIFTELAGAFPKLALVNELRARKQFGYPPYGHILQITLESSVPKLGKLKEHISAAITTHIPNLPLLGPVENQSGSTRPSWQWLIKLPRVIPYATLASLRTHLPTQARYELDPL